MSAASTDIDIFAYSVVSARYALSRRLSKPTPTRWALLNNLMAE
jgi:hypothetical protein